MRKLFCLAFAPGRKRGVIGVVDFVGMPDDNDHPLRQARCRHEQQNDKCQKRFHTVTVLARLYPGVNIAFQNSEINKFSFR
jgi:hypothetical protein